MSEPTAPKKGFFERLRGARAVADEGVELLEYLEHKFAGVGNLEHTLEKTMTTIHDLDAKFDALLAKLEPLQGHVVGILDSSNALIEENARLKADIKTLQEQVESHQTAADVTKQQDKAVKLETTLDEIIKQLVKVKEGVDHARSEKAS